MNKKINTQNTIRDDLQSRIRFRFSKSGSYKYFSHLNIISILSRAIRRSGIRVKYSGGFNPKPKMSFGPPTPLGIESHAEYGDIIVIESLNEKDFVSRLNDSLQGRLIITEAVSVQAPLKSLMSQVDIIKYSVYLDPGKMKKEKNSHLYNMPDILLKENEQISKEIYSFESVESTDNNSTVVLNLLGYAKILKEMGSKVFKFRDFVALLKEISGKHGIEILKIIKDELYIFHGGRLITPFEILL